jgi:hypothetical protein
MGELHDDFDSKHFSTLATKSIISNNMYFKPWISENYEKNKSGQRILILGESHYGDSKEIESNFTIDVIKDVIDGTKCRGYIYYTKLGKLFNEKNREEIFENCAFSNLVQSLLTAPRVHPTKEQLDEIHNVFWAILKHTKPNKVIVTSLRAWQYWLPDYDQRGIKLAQLEENGKSSQVWKYKFEDVDCLAIGIPHPSSRNFYSYRELVQKFLG